MIDENILKKLVESDNIEEFVCPDCDGSYFRSDGDIYKCNTGEANSFRVCGWKGLASECFMPSRAALASEILTLRAQQISDQKRDQ